MLKIMIVDDEEIIRAGLARMIEKGNDAYQAVALCRNGKEALERFTPDIDVIITDIQMPEMDGLTLVKEVKETYPNLPCIILSGFSDFPYAQQAIRYGVQDYLVKPVNKREVFHVLQSIHGKKEQAYDLGEHQTVRKVKSYIVNHYQEKIELQILAEQVFLDPSYLSRLFKENTGETITDFIMSVRIERAKELLVASAALKTYEVGHAVGYSDPIYFNKVFKKREGVTPKEYRTSKLNKKM
ncbi:response regulator [Ectobacillus sp. JY-23]|uniref:response regulator transcription factor n=1 Tax=Ectobacillus sp. JY-23 TaxID=2933872 RepID=UPI001FF33494|nr:response regulator [Ectobacillus sp. JY-23]UOY92236.1 response regulator [Ectobacillus sp. JY-23]